MALGAVALASFAIALAARESGALAPLEREALKARFDVRGTEPVDGLLVVGIDAKTFGDLQKRWPFQRSLHAQVVRQLHAAGARVIVYDVQFTEPTVRARTSRSTTPSTAPGGAVLATSESETDGSTDVLGGDDNLRSIGARAAASDLRNDTSGAIASFPRAAGSSTASPWSPWSGSAGTRPTRGRLPRRQGLDRLPRPARHHPDGLLLGRRQRPRAAPP